MSWVDEATNPQGLLAIFHGDPPSLVGVSVHEILISRDGPTIRIRLDLAGFPVDPPKKWWIAGFNTVQVELLFGRVKNLVMSGLSTEMIASIGLRRDGDIVFVVESPAMRLAATCASVSISRIDAYCDGREEGAGPETMR